MATEELPVTLAVSLHAPNDALRETMIPINARYPLARGHRRRARDRTPPRSSGDVRVRVHRGRQRCPRARRRAGRAARTARAARHPREPDPAQPHRRVRRPGRHRAPYPARSPIGSPPEGSHRPSGATGAPTSTPPAGSSESGRTGTRGPCRQECTGERVPVPQSVTAPDPRERHDPLLHPGVLRPHRQWRARGDHPDLRRPGRRRVRHRQREAVGLRARAGQRRY